MNKEIEATLKGLRLRNMNGFYAENSEEAKNMILKMIPKNAVVGMGDSTTVRQIGVVEELKKRGTKVLDGFDHKDVYKNMKDWDELHIKPVQQSITGNDVYLSGTNVITEDGRLLNADGVGNRVAGLFWGNPKVIIVVSRNKIVKNLDDAFQRLRMQVAPYHLRLRGIDLGGRKPNTPCITIGKCTDCRSKERACNVFGLIEGKPHRTEMNIIIVNEDLGLGWDESWPKERINKIIESYKKCTWIPADLDKLRKQS